MTEMTVRAQKAAGGMLALTASAHFLNDMIQSVIPASIRCHSGEYTLSENLPGLKPRASCGKFCDFLRLFGHTCLCARFKAR